MAPHCAAPSPPARCWHPRHDSTTLRQHVLRVLHLEDSELDHELTVAHLRAPAARADAACRIARPSSAPHSRTTGTRSCPTTTCRASPGWWRWRCCKASGRAVPFILRVGRDRRRHRGRGDAQRRQRLPAEEQPGAPGAGAGARHRGQRDAARPRRRRPRAGGLAASACPSWRSTCRPASSASARAIAREIHDDVGGSLTALNFDLAWIARHAAARRCAQRAAVGARDGGARDRGQPAHHAQPAPGDPRAGPGGRAAVDGQPLREAHRHRLPLPHQPRTAWSCRPACRWWPTARRRRR